MLNKNRKYRLAKILELNNFSKKSKKLNQQIKNAQWSYAPSKVLYWIFGNTIENNAWAPENQQDVQRAAETIKKRTHEQLNIAGLTPVVGSIPLVINAILYHQDGDNYNAALCLVGAVISMLTASGDIELVRGIAPEPYTKTILQFVTKLTDNLPLSASGTIMESAMTILTNTTVEKILEATHLLNYAYGPTPEAILAGKTATSVEYKGLRSR